MRIVAGALGSRPIRAPKGAATRPTSDRVREALFSSLASLLDLEGAVVLDAYAGSGALALEALSRGAGRATLFELDRSALDALRANVSSLGMTAVATVVSADVEGAVARGVVPGGPFTLLFVDPPYRIDKSKVRLLIERLIADGTLARGAVVVWEFGTGERLHWPHGVELVKAKRYGSTSVEIGRVCEEEV